MPYAQAVTFIDQLPPIIQQSQQPLPPPSQFTAFARSHAPGNMQGMQGMQPPPQAPRQVFEDNPYYEEIIKDHPGIQSKIRKLDQNPFGKYEEAMNNDPSAQFTQWNNVPDYPIRNSPPGSVQQNYLPSSMNYRAQAQHLPVAQNIPTHYERPMVQNDSYPVVENYLNCRDVMAHINSCPICSALYHKNDRIYVGVIAILVCLIFIMVFRFSRKH